MILRSRIVINKLVDQLDDLVVQLVDVEKMLINIKGVTARSIIIKWIDDYFERYGAMEIVREEER